jgi:hypothetical protein
MNFTKTAYTVSLIIVGLGLAINGYSQSFLTNGLVAYYPFNGNANDASGNGNNGTVYGATLTTDRFGIANSAYAFDGTNSYIDIPQNPVLDSLTTNFTLSAWIWQTVITNTAEILNKQSSGFSDGWVFDTVINCTPNVPLLRLECANGPCNVTGTSQYSLMQWHHFVGTVSGSVANVYIDGILNGSGNVGNIPSNTLDIWIGSAHPSARSTFPACFNGIIDDIRIYNVAMSSNEVQQLYAFEWQPTVTVRKAVSPSFSNLYLGTNYQLQVSSDLNTWTNQGAPFTPTNTIMDYPQYFNVANWNELFFRLQVSP